MHLNAILPPEAISNLSRIILTGDNNLLIEQHKGLFSYDESCINVQLAGGMLFINGKSLLISEFSARDICIRGEICSLEFKR